MRCLHIGLDFDGVISDCGRLKSEVARKLYGVDIPSSEFKKELVVGRGLLTMEQYRNLQHVIYGTHEHGLTAEPVQGVLEGLTRLFAAGHRVRIITSRDGEELAIAQAWTALRRLTLDFTGVGYGKSKAAAATGCDIYVDDDLDKLAPLVGIVPNLYLFSWGYNRHIDETGVAKRVASWEELHREITSQSLRNSVALTSSSL